MHGKQRISTLEDIWNLHEDEISLTKGFIWTGSQQKQNHVCVLRDAEIEASLGAREAQMWLSTAAGNPWPSPQPAPQLPGDSWCTGHRYRARAGILFPAITAHLAMVWDTQSQAKLSNTNTWKKITPMKAKKGLMKIRWYGLSRSVLQSFRHCKVEAQSIL